MSVGDIDNDGEYEYFVKWDPDNSHDVSIKGYTGRCFIDCYKLDGTLVWRLDMGQNIRAGAHYTQFMVYDFNGDGRAEMAVKTAPGTVMTRFAPDGTVLSRRYITMPQKDLDAGYSHADNYVCTAQDYRLHMAEVFRHWHTHPEVVNGRWPATVEQCFGLAPQYAYPLCEADALALADYFLDVYAPSRSPKNELRKFEGFVYDGPEYLTMFGGDGAELDTIDYPYPRVDDGLLWGDYAMPRIEPCNRVDRFNAGVAYLDGERPYLIACRGYYTRATLAAYDFLRTAFTRYGASTPALCRWRTPSTTAAATLLSAPTLCTAFWPGRATTAFRLLTLMGTAAWKLRTAQQPSTMTEACSTPNTAPCRTAGPAPSSAMAMRCMWLTSTPTAPVWRYSMCTRRVSAPPTAGHCAMPRPAMSALANTPRRIWAAA